MRPPPRPPLFPYTTLFRSVVLRVQLPTVAIPLAVVVWVPPVTLPLPAAGAKVTVTPATGLPVPSCTITAGGEARKSLVGGKRVDLGGRRIIEKKNTVRVMC